MIWNVGYQYTFGRKTDTPFKPIVGLAWGMSINEVNFGIQYKRSQFLVSAMFFDPTTYDDEWPIRYTYSTKMINLKYQFLLF